MFFLKRWEARLRGEARILWDAQRNLHIPFETPMDDPKRTQWEDYRAQAKKLQSKAERVRRVNDSITPPAIAAIFVAAAVGVALIAATLLHKEIGSGQQSGVIVAVDHGGKIWKTTTVYMKTDQYASDTDEYCVTDPAVREQLRAAVESGVKVMVHYTEHLFWSDGCEWTSDETIYKVEVL